MSDYNISGEVEVTNLEAIERAVLDIRDSRLPYLDECAMRAMQGIIASLDKAESAERIAVAAYETAEAMLAERERRKG